MCLLVIQRARQTHNTNKGGGFGSCCFLQTTHRGDLTLRATHAFDNNLHLLGTVVIPDARSKFWLQTRKPCPEDLRRNTVMICQLFGVIGLYNELFIPVHGMV